MWFFPIPLVPHHLKTSPQLKPLASTLNLLGVLVISLPSFSINLLKPTNGPGFLETICTMIVNLLQASNTNSKECEKVEERELYLTVAREVFGLLDAIIYSLPSEYHYQLSRILFSSIFLFVSDALPGSQSFLRPRTCSKRCSAITNQHRS